MLFFLSIFDFDHFDHDHHDHPAHLLTCKKKSKKSGKKFVDRNEIFLPLHRRTMSARCAPRARSIFYQAGEKLQPAQRAKTDDGRKTKR